jgi:hypothetical protein
MSKVIEIEKAQSDIVYYTDEIMDCEVTLNRIEGTTVYFNVVSTNNGGYLSEDDGTIGFPMGCGLRFIEK